MNFSIKTETYVKYYENTQKRQKRVKILVGVGLRFRHRSAVVLCCWFRLPRWLFPSVMPILAGSRWKSAQFEVRWFLLVEKRRKLKLTSGSGFSVRQLCCFFLAIATFLQLPCTENMLYSLGSKTGKKREKDLGSPEGFTSFGYGDSAELRLPFMASPRIFWR